MRPLLPLALLLLAALAASSCAEGPAPAGGAPAEDQGAPDQGQEDAARDQDVTPDLPPDLDLGGPPQPGQYGAPCDLDGDCQEGFCVPDGERGVCSRFCLEGCEPFYPDRAASCRSDPSREGDLAFVCYPAQDLSCAPCLDDSQCDAGVCLASLEGGRCALPCQRDEDCAPNASCQEIQNNNSTLQACVPRNGTCTCDADREGAVRPCALLNGFGICEGQERCDPAQGWIGCDAPQAAAERCNGLDEDCDGVADDGLAPAPCLVEGPQGACPGLTVCLGEQGERCVGPEATAELCDGVDNDCDGQIDEPFTDDQGRYASLEHCGACNNDCAALLPTAAEVACDDSGPTPRCVILSCPEGTQRVSDDQCAPLREVTCQPCAQDLDCAALSVGAACLTLGDPDQPETLARACGRDCAPDGAFGEQCPEGFTCQTFTEGERTLRQCAPTGGSCLCQSNGEGFAVPCALSTPENPQQTCQGVLRCQPDGGFGACEAPDEVCDGLDNDCDGQIDEGARDPATGRYDLSQAHCGRCNNDCGRLRFPNAVGACDTQAPAPTCQMACLPGFADLANGADDGCECAITDPEDHPDGQDQNCDGVDGDVARAVFVSKIGRPDAAGTLADPMDTVQGGIALAARSGGRLRDVYVSTGVYSENLIMASGVNVYGGYSFDFLSRDPARNQTTLFGQPPQGQERATVSLFSIQNPTRLEGFTIYGANASAPGANSYGLYLEDCDARVTVANNRIFGGNGGAGQRGGAGASGQDGVSGSPGARALASPSFICNQPATPGGAGGRLTCDQASVSGGGGGEARCPLSQTFSGLVPCDSRVNDCRNNCDVAPCSPLPPPQGPGARGEGFGGGAGGESTYDRWTDSGFCELCGLNNGLPHRGDPGDDGLSGAPGDSGQGCADARGGVDALGQWRAAAGGAGRAGQHGGGGGGGSAGSGFDIGNGAIGTIQTCRDTLGGSGGGGGSGGCAGTGGGGGTSGGGSFAVMIHYSRGGFAALPQLQGNILSAGAGGDGGPGGSAGAGGLGGLGADGGVAVSQQALCAEPGGRGGNGGDGGAGGGGGGGCGGPSVGIYLNRGGNDLNVASLRDQNTFGGAGRAGRPGPGGGSAAQPGTAGAEGLSEQLLQR